MNAPELSPIHTIELGSRQIHIKRDDLIHPEYGGNKWRKLKYNLADMGDQGIGEIVTFGGPFSNHIHAVAGAARDFNLQATAYIRGPVHDLDNPVLKVANECGMTIIPLSRQVYARRYDDDYLDALQKRHPDALLIPEGGTNSRAIDGCAEIAGEVEQQLGFLPDHWIVPGGTGGTAAGIAEGLAGRAQVHVIVAVKPKLFAGTFAAARSLISHTAAKSMTVHDRFTFGGLAKWNEALMNCLRRVGQEHQVTLDPLYTGKAWYAMEALIRMGEIPDDTPILFLHSGGKAGRKGFEYRYGIEL